MEPCLITKHLYSIFGYQTTQWKVEKWEPENRNE